MLRLTCVLLGDTCSNPSLFHLDSQFETLDHPLQYSDFHLSMPSPINLTTTALLQHHYAICPTMDPDGNISLSEVKVGPSPTAVRDIIAQRLLAEPAAQMSVLGPASPVSRRITVHRPGQDEQESVATVSAMRISTSTASSAFTSPISECTSIDSAKQSPPVSWSDSMPPVPPAKAASDVDQLLQVLVAFGQVIQQCLPANRAARPTPIRPPLVRLNRRLTHSRLRPWSSSADLPLIRIKIATIARA